MPVTLEDIARALNVSKMTVSRAINNHPEISPQTRERILATAQTLMVKDAGRDLYQVSIEVSTDFTDCSV